MRPKSALAAEAFGARSPWPVAWRRAGLSLALTWVGLILLFHREWSAMAGQWWHSSTYTHILLVPAILAWLVHVRAPQLALLSPRASWLGLLAFAGAALFWLLGALSGIALAAQAGAVGMLGAAVLTLLGPKPAAALAFPLGYMVFLVPFGDELVPLLQMVTAKLTIALVEFGGTSASIDGVFIDTPAGLFEVAEACSGVKFLIAMAAFGVLVANVCFRSWPRRIAFVGFALVLPVLANGVRAWGTIVVAQFVGAERATGFDHLVYGWVFFALVIAATLAIGWRFFDRAPHDPMIDAGKMDDSLVLSRLDRFAARPVTGLAVMAAAGLLFQAWAGAAERMTAPLPPRIALPEVPGWKLVDEQPAAHWRPRAAGANHRLLARYRDERGHEVDVFYALYSAQREGQEAGASGEGALPPDSGWSWQSPGPASDAKSDRLLGPRRTARLAETRYRTGGLLTGSNLRLKLATMADRLLLRARPTALLILSAEQAADNDAVASLRAFRTSAGPLGPWMDRIAAVE